MITPATCKCGSALQIADHTLYHYPIYSLPGVVLPSSLILITTRLNSCLKIVQTSDPKGQETTSQTKEDKKIFFYNTGKERILNKNFGELLQKYF